MEPVSDDDKVRIAADFIKAAPPGEFKEVFNDVRVLLGNDKLLQRATEQSQCLFEHATEQLATVTIKDADESTHNCLITQQGRIEGEASKFFDPTTGKVFKYDYLRETAEFVDDCQPPRLSPEVEKWRAAVQNHLKTYVDEYYPSPVWAVYGCTSDDGNCKITVSIENHKFQPQNFWNGKWKSTWSMELPTHDCNGYNVVLTGSAKADVHYYEDGNVQLNTGKSFNVDVMVNGVEEGAKKLVDAIKKVETEYQTSINESYTEMNTATFKQLRRMLPITSQLVDWHKLRGMQVGKELQNRNN